MVSRGPNQLAAGIHQAFGLAPRSRSQPSDFNVTPHGVIQRVAVRGAVLGAVWIGARVEQQFDNAEISRRRRAAKR